MSIVINTKEIVKATSFNVETIILDDRNSNLKVEEVLLRFAAKGWSILNYSVSTTSVMGLSGNILTYPVVVITFFIKEGDFIEKDLTIQPTT